jgi:hypothetical protein
MELTSFVGLMLTWSVGLMELTSFVGLMLTWFVQLMELTWFAGLRLLASCRAAFRRMRRLPWKLASPSRVSSSSGSFTAIPSPSSNPSYDQAAVPAAPAVLPNLRTF